MFRARRKTAPRVVDGRTQFKNNWELTTHWSQTPVDGVVVDKERPGEGYRHYLRKRDVERFLALLPAWEELSHGVDAVLLAAGDPRSLGWYRPGIVAICAWERELETDWDLEFVEEHRSVLERLGVRTSATPDRRWVRLELTENAIRGFQLMHILLHELGHHHDRMTTHSRARSARGEGYAEWYALRYADELWDAYYREFDW